jgi:large subunit ribosomal protein L10
MPSQQNIDLLKDTADKIARSKNVVIVEYQGLDVKSQVELRANIKKAGGELNVTKNRLVKLALKDRLKDIPESLESALNGPSAIVFGYDDAVAATKALMDFVKDHDTLKAKVGILMADSTETTDKVLTATEVEALSKLPGRQELLTMLVIQLQSPIQGFYNVLKGNLSGLARVLNAIKEKQQTN